jgi:hypothetical protein
MSLTQKNSRAVLAVLLLSTAVFASAQEAPRDIIVVVDTSTAMNPFYTNVTAYLSGTFLEENLNPGDTLHLLSFAAKPRLEIVRRVMDEGDLQTVIGRIFLLYPVDPPSDIAAAVQYAERYAGTVPQGRRKSIFVVSSGDGESLVAAAAARLGAGTTIHFLKVPLTVGRPAPPVQPVVPAPPPVAALPPATATAAGRPSAAQPVPAPAVPSPVQSIPSPAAPVVPPPPDPARTEAASPPELEAVLDATPEAVPDAVPPVSAGSEPVPDTVSGAAEPETNQPKPSNPPVQPKLSNPFERINLEWLNPAAFVSSLPPRVLIFPCVFLLLAIGCLIIVRFGKLNAAPKKALAAAGNPRLPRARPGIPAAGLAGRHLKTASPASVSRQPSGAVPAAAPPADTAALPDTKIRKNLADRNKPVLPGTPLKPQGEDFFPHRTEIRRDLPEASAASASAGQTKLNTGSLPAKAVPERQSPVRSSGRFIPEPGLPSFSLSGFSILNKKRGSIMGLSTLTAGLFIPHPENPNRFSSDNPMVHLFVEDQNPNIGMRNTHTLKRGNRYTLGGGGFDDFFVFLVPLPSAIGELRFDESGCSFVPLKNGYFPDIGSQPVPECIGKTIRIVSDKQFDIFFRFERYIDPLVTLNTLLRSIHVPGE